MTGIESKLESEQLIFKLERNHRCVLRWAKDLNSYRFEPRNYEGYVKLRELKRAFVDLTEKQSRIIDAMHYQNVPLQEASEEVEDSIQQYHSLERAIAEYLQEA